MSFVADLRQYADLQFKHGKGKINNDELAKLHFHFGRLKILCEQQDRVLDSSGQKGDQ